MTDYVATTFRWIFLLMGVALFFSACKTVKNYPLNKPFVYETKVTLEGDFSAKEKKELIPQLEQQLADSVKTRWVNKFLVLRSLQNPPVYDSVEADRSLNFMRGLLHSLGYFRDSITYDDTVIVRNDQLRTYLNFRVVSAKLFRLDSINYNLLADTANRILHTTTRDTLQQLTIASLPQSVIKRGDPFSAPLLSQELGRLGDVYRNNGFLRFQNDELLVLWDTVGLALIRPTLDPIEQAQQLEQLRRRRANPTTDIEFRLRTTEDTTRLIRYHVGRVRVFPDLNADTALFFPTIDTVRGYEFISYANLFKPRKLVDYIYLKQGELYRQSNYLRTQNRFNALTSFRLVAISSYPRPGQDTVDFDIKLTPARKYQFTANLEGSRNQTPLIAAGNLLGLGVNLGLQNRNFNRAANLASTNFRYGIELNAAAGQSKIQTQQFSLSHNIQFPRRVSIGLPLFKGSPDKVRTLVGLNLAYTNRTDYFTVRSINASFGYEKSWENKLLSVRFPSVEYYYLNRGDSLLKLINTNSSYRYIFNNGLILSSVANLTIASGRQNRTRLLTFSGELAGLAASLIPSKFLDSNLYRFARFDAEFRQTHKIRRSAIAWRLFAGVGVALPSSSLDSLNLYLPFFRQYFAGGPNSMRAWGIRRLGPGSALKSFNPTDAPDRFGDMRLEANLEYRFYIANLGGVILNGAFFTDIGNVWFLRENLNFPGGEFRLNKLWKDIAIGAGTGLRVDFSFLKLRFEYAYKVKDPTPASNRVEDQNRWFNNWQLGNGQFQLGIDYPF
jgi:outer membrane protein insertion porin family